MLTRAEDTDEEPSQNGGDDGAGEGRIDGPGVLDDDASGADGWAVVSVEDGSAGAAGEGGGYAPPPTDLLDLSPDARAEAAGDGCGMVSSLSAADDEPTADYGLDGDGGSLLGPYGYGHGHGYGSDPDDDEEDVDGLFSVPDTVPSNVRSIRFERGGGGGSSAAAGSASAAARRRYRRSGIAALAAIAALGSALAAYLAWDRSAWRMSALRLEAELKALREQHRGDEQHRRRENIPHHGKSVPPLFGNGEEDDDEPEPSIVVDNCWVKARATVSLGTCANELRDNVHGTSETVLRTVRDAFDVLVRTWEEAWDGDTAESAAAAAASASAAGDHPAGRTAAAACRTAADSVARSAGRVADGLAGAAAELLSSPTVASASGALVGTGAAVEETVNYLLDQAKGAIEDSSSFLTDVGGSGAVETVHYLLDQARGAIEESSAFLTDAGGGSGGAVRGEGRSTETQEMPRQCQYGPLCDLVSGLFSNATSRVGDSSVGAADAAPKSSSTFLARFSDAMKRAMHDSASVDEEDELLL